MAGKLPSDPDELDAKINAVLDERTVNETIDRAFDAITARRIEREKDQHKRRLERIKKNQEVWSRREWNLFGEEYYAPFLAVLEETGMYGRAAKSVGCHSADITQYRKDNPEFQQLCNEALENYRDMFISAAQDRAIDGIEFPIIGGRNKDQVVAHEVRHSDRLMELFLKRGTNGTFTERQEVTMAGGVDIRQEMNLGELSSTAKRMLRDLLEQINYDNARKALGEKVD